MFNQGQRVQGLTKKEKDIVVNTWLYSSYVNNRFLWCRDRSSYYIHPFRTMHAT